MSLSPQKLDVVQVRYPISVISNKRDFAVLKNGSQTTFKQYTTNSISSSSIQFSCPPPSGSIIVSRKQYFTLPMRIALTGTAPVGSTLIQAGHDAPRAFPIASITDTLQVTINNQSVSINLADIVQALMHYNTDLKLKTHDYSLTPTCLDQSQQYSDLFGTIRNPLGGYGDSNDEGVMGRGGFPFTVVSNPVSSGTPVTAIIDMVVTEPLFLSPFYWGSGNSSGFYNVVSMDYNITFIGNAYTRVWSHDDQTGLNATAITSGAVVFNNFTSLNAAAFSYAQTQPLMLFEYVTPQETQLLSPNMPITYPYFDVQRYFTDGNAVGPGVTTIINSNNIQLNSIPRRLYVYVRPQNNTLYSDPANTDTYFQINNISIQHMNKNGLLASASAHQLYLMSVSNHCNMSWTQWNGETQTIGANGPSINACGSILCIEFAKDIGLDALDAPGKNVQNMLQIQLTCTNLSASTITPTLVIIAVLDGTFTIEGLGRSSTNVGVITSQDILDAQSKPFVNWKDVENVNGGDFWSGLKDFGKSLWEGLRGVHDFAKENKLLSKGLSAFPVTAPFAPVANALGYGQGGVVLGGEGMSRNAMRRRLMS